LVGDGYDLDLHSFALAPFDREPVARASAQQFQPQGGRNRERSTDRIGLIPEANNPTFRLLPIASEADSRVQGDYLRCDLGRCENHGRGKLTAQFFLDAGISDLLATYKILQKNKIPHCELTYSVFDHVSSPGGLT
jgi:hypothetical protein